LASRGVDSASNFGWKNGPRCAIDFAHRQSRCYTSTVPNAVGERRELEERGTRMAAVLVILALYAWSTWWALCESPRIPAALHAAVCSDSGN
jgi:hypothetical protein